MNPRPTAANWATRPAAEDENVKYSFQRIHFNEVSLKLGKWIFQVIFFIIVRITWFLVSRSSAKHKQSIGVVFAKIWWELRKPKISHFLISTPTPSRVESHKIRWGTAGVDLSL